MKRILSLLFVVTLLCSSCASIVSKSTYPVTVSSNPSGATVTVMNKKGIEIHKATTPLTITLSAKSGYFRGASYSFRFEKDGYLPQTASLSAGMDGWYLGNIIFGGLVGILIVDPATGAMWRLKDTVTGNLVPDPAAKPTAAPEPEVVAEEVEPMVDAVDAEMPESEPEGKGAADTADQ